MNLFENLINIEEWNSSKRVEELVDRRFLQDNGIDFYENGSGELIASTLDGYTKILVNIDQAEDDRWFVTLPEEDINTTNRDLTIAIFDAVTQIDDFNLFESKRISKKNQFNKQTNISKIDNKLKVESDNSKLWYTFMQIYNGSIPIEDLTNYFSLDQFGEFVQWLRHEEYMDYDYNKRYRNWNEVFEDLNEVTGVSESISLENVFNFFSTADLEDFLEWVEREYDLDSGYVYESKKSSLKEYISVLDNEVYKTINYIRDELDMVESYVNDGVANSADIVDFLRQIYSLVNDMTYKCTHVQTEATSGIGSGSYTTKAIDILPGGFNKSNKKLKMN